MIDFLKEYKEVIVSGLVVILIIFCMLIKRRPKTLDEFYTILVNVSDQTASFVSKVESLFGRGSGSQKKEYCLGVLIEALESHLHRSLSKTELKIANEKFSTQIEEVLTAPQKKVL